MSPAQAQALAAAFGEPSPILLERLAVIERQNAAILAALEGKGNDDGWIDKTAAQKYLGMCKNTFEKYLYESETNRLPRKLVGGKLKFKKSELDRWVKLSGAREAGLA